MPGPPAVPEEAIADSLLAVTAASVMIDGVRAACSGDDISGAPAAGAPMPLFRALRRIEANLTEPAPA
ncbi:hypothetical protein, partial [Nocardia africana]